ncbi:MAG TPA: adenine deaminase [Bacteroidales bacterium]|nr:adenine deaminase [Bacteroidales bacterium]
MKISGKIVDLHKRKIYTGEISFMGGTITAIKEVESAPDLFIMPGLTDAHVHIESSMVTPSQFAVAAVRHGTVAVVSDPHEIANVMGVEGINFMLDNAASVPVKFSFGAPSCVPATSFESSGAVIGPEEVRKLLLDKRINYLAEMMNFPGVIYGDEVVTAKLKIAHNAGVVIDGHAPGLTGGDLVKYAAAGISTDHECSTIEEALEKISLGMNILIREGSAAKNLNALASLLESHPDRVMLCSDDLHPEMLERGHINLLVARLVNKEYDLFNILRAASVNAAVHYSLGSGLLRVGDKADFIVVDDPGSMKVMQTWIDGIMVFDGSRTLFDAGIVSKINKFNCNHILTDEIEVKNGGATMRVITAQNGELLTGSVIVETGNEPLVHSRPDEDILKIVVKERYNDAPPSIGFIRGFRLKQGAMATSVAHDSHNIIAVGVSDEDIVKAVNMVVDAGGGMAVVSEQDSELLPLPVAGIMSDMPVSAIAESYLRLTEAVKRQGSSLDAPFMTLSFMALLVIPELKLSDKGLFDGKSFRFVPLFAE